MRARVIAFYLPQFHPVKENDEMWGKGFTEWTNVAKAKPLFKGHYQPQIPADLGFYDLRLSEVREQQAIMAKEAGVEGFCYWHYWFGNGKRILERPFEEILKSGKPDFPFCLGWANHSWSNKTWQKTERFTRDVTFIQQTYPGDEDYIKHFYAVLPAFKDSRYITIDNKPVFLVFDPEAIPNMEHFIHLWNELAIKNGLEGVYFIARVTSVKQQYKGAKIGNKEIHDRYQKFLDAGFDAINSDMQKYAEIKVGGFLSRLVRFMIRKTLGNNKPAIYDYSKIMDNYYIEEDMQENVFPQIIPRLDRTPRSGKEARIYLNSTPEKFGIAIDKALNIIDKKESEHKVLFLQAWNEWGEGNYMEPDLKFGHSYLDVLSEKLGDR